MSCDDLYPPPVDAEANVYRVERIWGHKLVDGERWFKIKWFGFPWDNSTFEPESNLTDCAEILNEYLTRTVYLKETEVDYRDMPPLERVANVSFIQID